MVLRIETFSNTKGGNAFFKAVGHPLAARRAGELLARLRGRRIALYDPHGFAADFAELYDLSGLRIAGVFVQDLADLGKTVLGQPTQPVTDLKAAAVDCVFVVAFDVERPVEQIRHLVPEGAQLETLESLRLPEDMLADRRNYLNPLNFATNYVLFREAGGHHTRLVTANYWSRYGARDPELWCCLFDSAGAALAEWREPLPGADATIVLDSSELRRRFDLSEYTGQLFLHVLRPAGHDIVKYALDTYGDEPSVLSCTHDANAWPAERYAGVPAPKDDERVVVWVQNSHPAPIPPGAIGLNRMGREAIAWCSRPVPPFGVEALDTRELLPDARWPAQIEVRAGKHFVRPRYEVIAANGHSRIAHANVEREDLRPDPHIPELANLLGKGYLLPAPILPPERFRSLVLPTPMAACQDELPIKALVYDAKGRELGAHRFGRLARDHASLFDAGALLADGSGAGDGAWGHVELVYDFSEGGAADGWLHGLFRYEDRRSGHAAETSFGSHVFNTVLTYRGEPQSYAGRPPGLSTRLFLRLGRPPLETLCHLIYPASTPWHAQSDTRLILHDAAGAELAERPVAIPCGGSLLWRAAEMFEPETLRAAGDNGYVIVRDATCRLFGYHGLVRGETAFSLDHMFGF